MKYRNNHAIRYGIGVIINLCGLALVLATNIVVARIAGPKLFGLVGLTMSITLLFIVLSQVGFTI